ncbi:MAG: putative LPS assembly protein LptD [Flavobacteriales bacterium]
MCNRYVVTAQDTLLVNDSSMQNIVNYSAGERIFNDLEKKQIHLFGNAKVEMEGLLITAGYILLDLNANEIWAKYRYDKDSNKVEFPVFTDGGESVTCHTLKYNTKTQKGFLEELAIKQDEFYFHMETAKRHPNEEIHLLKGRLTTCDLDEPHYHFQLSKGVIVPNERIVTGPMNLWVNGIPTPLGLPFAFIPTKEQKKNGLLFPDFVPMSNYGFGVQNLGYFFPINDHLQTAVYANLYSRGSWGLRNDLDYSKRYGFTGRISIGFQQFNMGFPTNDKKNKLSIQWTHRKAAKSNPFWSFSSSVNFISDNTAKNNLDPINPDYFKNSFNSDINLNRAFPGKPLSMGMKVSMRQNANAKNIALLSPILTANVTRIFPFKNTFKSSDKNWKKTIERIGVTYNFEGQNRSNFADSLLAKGDMFGISQQFMNGLSQSMTIQTTTGLFGNAIKINPTINYGNKINFQQVQKFYDPISNKAMNDTLQKFGMAHELNVNVNVTTVVYSYYQFVGKNKPKLRHLITPSAGFRYVPKLNDLIQANVGANQSTVKYSPFENSVYTVGNTQAAALLNFGINNTMELKVKSEKDTLTGYRKIRLIDQLSISGNYDYLKDSMRLSNLALNLRISPADWINFVSGASFSPYSWDPLTGKTLGSYALVNQQGIGRFLSTNLTTTLTIAPKKSREKVANSTTVRNEQNWNADFNYYALHPERAIFFDIPWKMNISHVYSINTNQSITTINPTKNNFTQTLVLSGDLSLTKRWNLSGNLNFNLQDFRLTNAYFSLNRNLHCWALSFYYVPIGGNKSFLFSIRNTSSIFKDAKIEIRKPPALL